jgi:predicted RNA binding protein YcfA (HicA-like mRNA interferase family)
MASFRKVFDSILTGRSDSNVRFADLQRILRRIGFSERTKGSHFIYTRDGVDEIINIQEGSGGKSKPYQVKQIRGIITRYQLSIEDEE